MQRSRSLEHQRWHKQQAEKSSSHLWPVQCTLILAVVKCTGLMQKHFFQSSVKWKRSYWFGLNQEALEPPETVHCLHACFLPKKFQIKQIKNKKRSSKHNPHDIKITVPVGHTSGCNLDCASSHVIGIISWFIYCWNPMLRPHAALQKIHAEPVWIVCMPSSKLPNWYFSFLNFWCISLTKPYEYARVGVALLHRVVDQGVSKCPARWCMWSFALDRSVQNPFESFCILQNPSKSLQIFNFPNPLGSGLFWLQPIGIASVAFLLSNRSHDQKTANHTEAQLHKDWSTSLHLGSQQPMHSATENLGPSKAVGSWVVSSSKCHFPPEIHLSSFFE